MLSKLYIVGLIFVSCVSQARICNGFANYMGVMPLFSPGQNVSKNLGKLTLRGFQRICNKSGQCSELKPIPTQIGLYWQECTQSSSGTCHYEDRYKTVNLSDPTKSAFFFQQRSTDLNFAFNLPDNSGHEHSYFCKIDSAAIKNGEVTCVQNAVQRMYLVWGSDRRGLGFKGRVSNNCIQVTSDLTTTVNGLTSYITYEISGTW